MLSSILCELLTKPRVTVSLSQLLLVLVTLSSRDACAVIGTANIFSLADKEQILDGHNTWRSVPDANNMILLRWSEELSTIAQDHSLTCPEKRDRNPNRNSISTTFENVGENIAAIPNSMFENRTYSEILNTLWVEMNQLTTTLISTCFGPYCEEYAQVVWADTEFVGCGSSVCDNTTVVVCDYAPGATDLTFNASSFPYGTSGARCSACPSFAANCTESGLCYDPSFNETSSAVPTTSSVGQSSTAYVSDSSSLPTPYLTITPSPSSATSSITVASEMNYSTVNYEHSLSNRPSIISDAQTLSHSVKTIPASITPTLPLGTMFGSSSFGHGIISGSSTTITHHVTTTPSMTPSASSSRTGVSESMSSRYSEIQTSSHSVKAIPNTMTPTLNESAFGISTASTDMNKKSTLPTLKSSSPSPQVTQTSETFSSFPAPSVASAQVTQTSETLSSFPAPSVASVTQSFMSTDFDLGTQNSLIQTTYTSVSKLGSKVNSIIPTPTYSVTVQSMADVSESSTGSSHAKSIPFTVTVTVTQTPGATNISDDCKCTCTDSENTCSLGRLPLLYVLVIGIVPSVLAIALLLILIIVLCMNCRRKSKVGKKYVYHFRSPDGSNPHPQRQRRMQVHDTLGLSTTPDTLTSVHLRPISPPTASASLEPDIPLLPDPPATFMHEDYSSSAVGSTFNLVVPENNYIQDSSFSSFSNYSSEGTFIEEFSSRPPLECIREEIGEGGRETGEMGVARIIAKLEQGKGRILNTEC